MAPSCHLFFILLNIIFPVREIGVKDRVYTSVRGSLSLLPVHLIVHAQDRLRRRRSHVADDG